MENKAKIINQSFSGTFTYDNTDMLFLDLKNIVVNLENKNAQNKINKVIKVQTEEFLTNAINNLYNDAVNDYISRNQDDFPFNAYGANLDYNVAYNDDCTLSYYYDNYQFTGGAHGSTIRKSNTFNLNNGNQIPLSAYFGSNYKIKVLQNILKQAQQNMQNDPGIYFENYEKLIIQYFNPQSYYLTKDGIVIYYQQYEIGPYAIGIVEFLIPYSEVTFPPICK